MSVDRANELNGFWWVQKHRTGHFLRQYVYRKRLCKKSFKSYCFRKKTVRIVLDRFTGDKNAVVDCFFTHAVIRYANIFPVIFQSDFFDFQQSVDGHRFTRIVHQRCEHVPVFPVPPVSRHGVSLRQTRQYDVFSNFYVFSTVGFYDDPRPLNATRGL